MKRMKEHVSMQRGSIERVSDFSIVLMSDHLLIFFSNEVRVSGAASRDENKPIDRNYSEFMWNSSFPTGRNAFSFICSAGITADPRDEMKRCLKPTTKHSSSDVCGFN